MRHGTFVFRQDEKHVSLRSCVSTLAQSISPVERNVSSGLCKHSSRKAGGGGSSVSTRRGELFMNGGDTNGDQLKFSRFAKDDVHGAQELHRLQVNVKSM